MNLRPLDWLIVFLLLAAVGAVAHYTQRYTRSVSDFLAGNRCAGRYLLTLSEGISSMGLVGVLANFEQFYKAGFAATWWGTMLAPLGLVLALSGWVSYRYRETRAMTMAQFFEMRYSRRFRVFSGIVGWFSGILNFGVFPGIVARFLIYFCGLPPTLHLFGLAIPTVAPVMLFMLSLTLLLVLGGGMVTIMVTDFVQAQFINLVFLTVGLLLFAHFKWADIVGTLQQAPAGHSMINPFQQGNISDFNLWFFLIMGFKLFYNRLGWQGTQGFNCSAKSPHEARMAGILAEWRAAVSFLMLSFMPVCAYVVLHNPQFAEQAARIGQSLNAIADPQIREQMTVPVTLSQILPVGLVGLLCAAMIAGTIGNDTTYLHSWGSIFIQDVVMPFRKTHLSPARHLRLLRCSIVGVAVFSFVYSLVFPLHDYIFMYFLVTGAVYLAGSGSAIIGGLYWSRGTTAGAWTAMIVGIVVALLGALLRNFWDSLPFLLTLAPQFPLNGAWMAFSASIAAIVAYISVSLLTCRQPFDMDKLLNRTAAASEKRHAVPEAAVHWRWLGINAEFTRGDRLIYFFKIGWTLFWSAAFVGGTVVALTVGIPDKVWSGWWLFGFLLTVTVGVITIVWFLIGGIRDLRHLFQVLASTSRDRADDGTVPVAGDETLAPAPAEVAPPK